MAGFENFPLPNEIIFKIFDYLDTQNLYQCCKVSKRFKEISLSKHAKRLQLSHAKEWQLSVAADLRNQMVDKL